MGRSVLLFTKNHEPAAGCAGYWDDLPRSCCQEFGDRTGAGGTAGTALQFSASCSSPTPPPGGSVFRGRRFLWLAVSEFCRMPWRPADGIYPVPACRLYGVKQNCRTVAAAGFFRILASSWGYQRLFPDTFEKNICFFTKKYKKSLCICKKIEYNKMELLF